MDNYLPNSYQADDESYVSLSLSPTDNEMSGNKATSSLYSGTTKLVIYR